MASGNRGVVESPKCNHSDAGGNLIVWSDRFACDEPCGEWHIRCTRCNKAVYGCILEGTK